MTKDRSLTRFCFHVFSRFICMTPILVRTYSVIITLLREKQITQNSLCFTSNSCSRIVSIIISWLIRSRKSARLLLEIYKRSTQKYKYSIKIDSNLHTVRLLHTSIKFNWFSSNCSLCTISILRVILIRHYSTNHFAFFIHFNLNKLLPKPAKIAIHFYSVRWIFKHTCFVITLM